MNNLKDFRNELKFGYTLIEFSGDSCANCITLMPILQQIVSEKTNLTLLNINVSKSSEDIVEYYEIRTAPTVILLYNDILLGKVTGLQPKEILEIWVETKIEEFEKVNKK